MTVLYKDRSPPYALVWLASHAGLHLHDDVQLTELVQNLLALCDRQIQLSQQGEQIPLNELIEHLQSDKSEESALNRMLAMLTAYSSFALFLEDISGSLLLPNTKLEPLCKRPTGQPFVPFEIYHTQAKAVLAPGDPYGKPSWVDNSFLRGGASTLEGAFDVVMQVYRESRRMTLGGYSAELKPVSCTIVFQKSVIINAGFLRKEKITDGELCSISKISWNAADPLLGELLEGQTLIAWIADQYQKQGLALDLESTLANHLGL